MKWTLVGLGNPGSAYSWTRHNAGFLAVDFLHDKYACTDWKKKIFSNATVSTCEEQGNTITLVKPQTFMNLSGRAVQKYVKTPEEISHCIVIHDDVHLEIGTFKISVARGDGGHNGITSLHQTLKSKDFIRIRIGISPGLNSEIPQQKIKLDDFVLGKFMTEEKESLAKIFPKIEDAITHIIKNGVEDAMNFYNKK